MRAAGMTQQGIATELSIPLGTVRGPLVDSQVNQSAVRASENARVQRNIKIREMCAAGMTQRRIATELSVPLGTVHWVLKQARLRPSDQPPSEE
jgi:hypothetical protein